MHWDTFSSYHSHLIRRSLQPSLSSGPGSLPLQGTHILKAAKQGNAAAVRHFLRVNPEDVHRQVLPHGREKGPGLREVDEIWRFGSGKRSTCRMCWSR